MINVFHLLQKSLQSNTHFLCSAKWSQRCIEGSAESWSRSRGSRYQQGKFLYTNCQFLFTSKPYLHVIVLRYGYPYQHSTKLQCPISLPECSLQTGVCSLRNNNIISISQEMISAQVEKFKKLDLRKTVRAKVHFVPSSKLTKNT